MLSICRTKGLMLVCFCQFIFTLRLFNLGSLWVVCEMVYPTASQGLYTVETWCGFSHSFNLNVDHIVKFHSWWEPPSTGLYWIDRIVVSRLKWRLLPLFFLLKLSAFAFFFLNKPSKQEEKWDNEWMLQWERTGVT